MHPSSAGRTSRFHEVCAWAALLKMPAIEATLPRPSALSKPDVGVADRGQVGLVGIEASGR